MDNPDISIILTAYNVERYIAAALESALAQTGVTLEVIAVDDASTDATWHILSTHADPRLHCIRLDHNSGPSAARNRGIAQARGRYLAVLDGDDQFLPGRLSRCLARAHAQNADIVIDNLLIHRETDSAEFPMFPGAAFATPFLDLATFIDSNRLFAGGYTLGYVKPLFSSAFLKSHTLSYDPSIRIGEDYQLMAEALASGARCAMEPTPGYRYTVRKGSISHRLKLEDITRMREGDARLLARYTFPADAMRAQARREACFTRAYAFTQLIDALKQKNPVAALRAIASSPGSALLLWMPIAARLKRLRQKVAP
jgi:succinoglycan biosynthesis protein ExoO